MKNETYNIQGNSSLGRTIDNVYKKTINPNRVAIYIRWSTDEQTVGNTLSMQLDSCKLYLQANCWNFNKDLVFIDEGYTGANLDRPGITKLKEHIEAGLVDCVVVWKVDRLSRNLVDMVDLVLYEWKYREVYLKSVNEAFDTSDPMGVMVLSMLAIFAQWERETIKLRTFSGKLKNISEKGLSPGMRPPYGYKTGTASGTFEIIEEEAAIVRRIFKDYFNGIGAKAITLRLNEDGLRFRANNLWGKDTVQRIIRNPLYSGTLVWGKTQKNDKFGKVDGEKVLLKREDPITAELSEEVLPRIISKEDFERAKEIFMTRREFVLRGTSGRALNSSHLLTGLLKCTCGSSMFGRKGNTTSVRYDYYICSDSVDKGEKACNCGCIRQDVLDKIVIDDIKEIFLQGQSVQLMALEEYRTRVQEFADTLENINKRLKTLDKNNSSYLNNALLDDGDENKLTPAVFNSLMSRIHSEIIELEQKQFYVQEQLRTLQAKPVDEDKFTTMVKALEEWDKLPLDKQKQLLAQWVSKITVFKEKRSKGDLYIKIEYETKVKEQERVHSYKIQEMLNVKESKPKKPKKLGDPYWFKNGHQITRKEYNAISVAAHRKGLQLAKYLKKLDWEYQRPIPKSASKLTYWYKDGEPLSKRDYAKLAAKGLALGKRVGEYLTELGYKLLPWSQAPNRNLLFSEEKFKKN